MNDGWFGFAADVDRDDLCGRLYPGLGGGPHHGVLVLHGGGGGGGYERAYARHLARHGYTALCVEYFDAPAAPDALSEVPLEYFERAAAWLADRPDVDADRVGVVGFSRGGEAALLTGTHVDRVGAVVAYVPSAYAFAAPTWMDGVDEERSAWTVDGEPVPYLPVDRYVDQEQEGLDEALGIDAPSAALRAVENAPEELLARAAIEVECIDGPVLLVSGGEDEAWPSVELADQAVERLAAHDHPWPFENRDYPRAGHAIRVPYRFDGSDDPTANHWLGGTNEANACASADAWHAALDYLRCGLDERSGSE